MKQPKFTCPHCDMPWKKETSLTWHLETCDFINDRRDEAYGILKFWFAKCPPRYKIKAGTWTVAKNFIAHIVKLGVRHPDVYMHVMRKRGCALKQAYGRGQLANAVYLDYLRALDFVPMDRLDRNARELLGLDDGQVVRELERKSIHPRLLELEPYQKRFERVLEGPHAAYLSVVLARC